MLVCEMRLLLIHQPAAEAMGKNRKAAPKSGSPAISNCSKEVLGPILRAWFYGATVSALVPIAMPPSALV